MPARTRHEQVSVPGIGGSKPEEISDHAEHGEESAMLDHIGLAGDTDPTTSADQRRRAVMAIAATAKDAQECAMLLDMLGLRPEDVRRRDSRAA